MARGSRVGSRGEEVSSAKRRRQTRSTITPLALVLARQQHDRNAAHQPTVGAGLGVLGIAAAGRERFRRIRQQARLAGAAGDTHPAELA